MSLRCITDTSFYVRVGSIKEASFQLSVRLKSYFDCLRNGTAYASILSRWDAEAVQQFAYTSGKNATDSLLIIDAMDLLYSRNFDGFCLVSSDSDFTGLAIRLRDEGLTVIGFGENKTPQAFRNACNKFIDTSLLKDPISSSSNGKVDSTKKEPVKNKTNDIYKIISKIIESVNDGNGWINLGHIGSVLIKMKPDFDSRTYGFKKLSDMLKSRTDIYVFSTGEKIGLPHGGLYIKIKSTLKK